MLDQVSLRRAKSANQLQWKAREVLPIEDKVTLE